MLRDNGVKYPPQFEAELKSAGLEVPRRHVHAPNLRAHSVRRIQTLQHEAFGRMAVLFGRKLNFITRNMQDWDNSQRPHSARDHLPPDWGDPRTLSNIASPPEIFCAKRLGRLVKSYSRRAA